MCVDGREWILSSCDKLASLRVTTGAALYQHTLEFRRYLSARFGDADGTGLMARPGAALSQNSEMSPISALLARLRHYTLVYQ
jgi:hypothetical protein